MWFFQLLHSLIYLLTAVRSLNGEISYNGKGVSDALLTSQKRDSLRQKKQYQLILVQVNRLWLKGCTVNVRQTWFQRRFAWYMCQFSRRFICASDSTFPHFCWVVFQYHRLDANKHQKGGKRYHVIVDVNSFKNIVSCCWLLYHDRHLVPACAIRYSSSRHDDHR